MKPEQEKPADVSDSEAVSLREVEDPIAKFFEQHWQRALYVLIGFGFLLYLYFGYQRSQEDSLRQAADLFNKVRSSLTEVDSVDSKIRLFNEEVVSPEAAADQSKIKEREDRRLAIETESKTAREKLHQRLSALADVKEPYKSLAPIYDGVSSLNAGDKKAARNALSKLDWRSVSDLDSEMRLAAELAALILARSLIEQPDSRSEGEKMLVDLAREASYVKVSAALTLSRIATSTEKRSEAKAVLEKIQLEHPEYADLVREQLERLSS